MCLLNSKSDICTYMCDPFYTRISLGSCRHSTYPQFEKYANIAHIHIGRSMLSVSLPIMSSIKGFLLLASTSDLTITIATAEMIVSPAQCSVGSSATPDSAAAVSHDETTPPGPPGTAPPPLPSPKQQRCRPHPHSAVGLSSLRPSLTSFP